MNILLVNPWIYDFAAYDLWLKPLGLLYISNILKTAGVNVYFIDCLDRFHPQILPLIPPPRIPQINPYGCGPFYAQEVPKPTSIRNIPRKYKRYGLPREIFLKELNQLPFTPDYILVTSGMTYWYQGVMETIDYIKDKFPKVPVILGGTYATLCYDHAVRYTLADIVYSGSNLDKLLTEILKLDTVKVPVTFNEFPSPDYSRYNPLPYVVLRLSYGCPFHCSYCAVSQIYPNFSLKNTDTVYQEISFYVNLGVSNLVLYDDALLCYVNTGLIPLLNTMLDNGINRTKLKIHTPNGLACRYINREIANLMYQSGFREPRLSLETINHTRQDQTGGKVRTDEFLRAVEFLRTAGYNRSEISVYVIIGLPNQPLAEVEETISVVKHLNLRVRLTEFSPIPGTGEYEKTGLSYTSDPLLHNNSVWIYNYCKDWQWVKHIKDDVFRYNTSLNTLST